MGSSIWKNIKFCLVVGFQEIKASLELLFLPPLPSGRPGALGAGMPQDPGGEEMEEGGGRREEKWRSGGGRREEAGEVDTGRSEGIQRGVW